VKRLVLICVCVTAMLMATTGLAAAAKTRQRSSNLEINAQEWSLWPSRSSLPAGTVYVELWNRGQDMHDTWIRRLNAAGQMVGPVLGKVRVTLPGHLSQATWHLKAGRYELFCSLPGHAALGMHARLTVKPS
jgi:uncharacterized cupredoxin-like copper-binding protein